MSANPETAAEPHYGALSAVRSNQGPVLVAYTLAVFASAFLLFLVQPMFGRMVLPLLGGSPAVWNTCMLFFQMALLGGYLYAHLGSRWLDVRSQWVLHLVLLALALLSLPISIRGAEPQPGDAPIGWLLRVMLTSVGPAFVILAATGPMLQRWFARTGHRDATEPYHLYAASNLGSMLALLAYPLLVEPRLRLSEQAWAWTVGFIGLALSIGACGAFGWAGGTREARASEPSGAHGPLLQDRAVWVLLAFVPSTLLLGVTTYITTDLTPAPLLWVIPLALYLLSFTLTFARRPPLPHAWMAALQPAVLAAVVIVIQRMDHLDEPAFTLPLHMLGLFLTAMVAHGELARRRPAVRHLTEFYLWIAVGGALGGLFNVLVAPLLFSELWEYPLALVLACTARPWRRVDRPFRTQVWLALRAVAFAVALVQIGREGTDDLSNLILIPLSVGLVGMFALALGRSPGWLAVCLGAVVVSGYVEGVRERSSLMVERSFFGQYRVNRSEYGYHVLQHGSTLHGAQSLAPRQRRDPLTYYVREGPLGDLFTSMGISTTPWKVAVVGLGAGTAAAYASVGDDWTFYELDPGIERIARDPRYFTYLADSPGRIRVVLGDARLSLQRDSSRTYDLILLDAFSSDAIPIHLLTREALDVYLSRLSPEGRIAIHISNRYLDLEPVLAAHARDRAMAALVGTGPPKKMGFYENSSTWVVLARSGEDLQPLTALGDWKPPRSDAGVRPWSDDFSSILGILRW